METPNNEAKENKIVDRRGALLTAVLATAGVGIFGTGLRTNAQTANNTQNGSTASDPVGDIIKNFKSRSDLMRKNVFEVDTKTLVSDVDKKLDVAAKPVPLSLSQDYEALRTKATNYLNNFEVSQNKTLITLKKDVLNNNEPILLTSLVSQMSAAATFINDNYKSFTPYTTELLLNAAAGLLERGMASRKEFDELGNKALELYLELDEFMKLDANLVEQSQNGLYDLDYVKVQSELIIETGNQIRLANAAERLKKLIAERYGDNNIKEIQESVFKLNFAGTNYAGFFPNGPDGIPREHTFHIKPDTADKSVAEYVSSAALVINEFNLVVQKIANEIQLDNLESNLLASSNRKAYLADRLKWEDKNRASRKERDNITRQKMLSKYQSMMEPDGVMNYLKRVIPLKKRFNADFLEAYIRLKAAEAGIGVMYEFTDKLPVYPNNGAPDVDFFDNCIEWTRNAIQHINRFTQAEVTGKHTISVRRLFASYDSFLESYASGKWVFEIKSDYFGKKYHVRLRGLSINLVSLGSNYTDPYNLDGCFKATIKIPATPLYRQKNNDLLNLPLASQGFPAIPEFEFGRVYSIEKNLPNEVVGGESIVNSSPIGKWEVILDPIFRNFYYEKNGNRIKMKSVFPGNTNTNGEFQTGTALNTQNIPDDMLAAYTQNHFDKYPKFLSGDFYDIQIELHLAYKI